jgi:thermitase
MLSAACQKNGAEVTSMAEKLTVSKMPRSFARGEVLVKFKPTVSTEKIDTLLKEAKTELIAQLKGTGIYHVRILSEESVESVAKKLSSQPEVEYAEPNLLYQQFK